MSEQGPELSAWAPPPTGTAYVEPAAAKKRRGKVLAAAVAAVVLAGGGVATAIAVSDRGPGGAGDPKGAAERLMSALKANDILGTIDALAPSERTVVREQVQAFADEGQRLGVFSDSLNLKKVPGYELSVDNLVIKSEPVNDKIASVTLASGQYRFATKTSHLPLGGLVTSKLAESGTKVDDRTVTGDLADLETPVQFATVKEGGSWYASLFYTAAEGIRRDAGAAAPDPNVTIAAKGAASPEQAVDELVSAAVAVDVQRLIELTPPDELAVLHEYGPLLVAEADRAKTAGSPFGATGVTVKEHQFETKQVDGGTKVLPVRVVLDVEENGQKATIEVAKVNGTCVHVVVSGADVDNQDEQVCADDIRSSLNDGGQLSTDVVDVLVRELGQLGEVGVVTVKADGKWYVSPTRTLSDVFFTFTRPLQRTDLDALIKAAGKASSIGVNSSLSGG